MIIIGADYHPGFQQIAFVDTDMNLTVVRVFHFGTSYGHQNGYRYELIAQEIRDVAVIQKGMKDIATERRAE
jgi:hypothetical protein